MPSCLPSWTAWVRRRAPSLSKARLQWVLTVFSLTKRRVAISRLLRPCAMSERISSSRGVIPSASNWGSFRVKGAAGVLAGTRTSRRTIVSRGFVSLMPSQIPKPAKRMAMREP